MPALDEEKNISGICATSGLAYKTYGRVGDSLILGAGMFCDNDMIGAYATGVGALVMKTPGLFFMEALTRNRKPSQEAYWGSR